MWAAKLFSEFSQGIMIGTGCSVSFAVLSYMIHDCHYNQIQQMTSFYNEKLISLEVENMELRQQIKKYNSERLME